VFQNIRKTDKAARYGGDEFVIILPHTVKSGALAFANKLHDELHNHLFVSDTGMTLKVSGSFGIASFPDDAGSSSELISAADEAMYKAKAAGRDTVCVAGCEGSSAVNPR